jgi:hypothetical protein
MDNESSNCLLPETRFSTRRNELISNENKKF